MDSSRLGVWQWQSAGGGGSDFGGLWLCNFLLCWPRYHVLVNIYRAEKLGEDVHIAMGSWVSS